MFITALFTVAKTRKQPQCPLIDDWKKKTWCIRTTEHYCVIKKEESLSLATTWMDLEIIMLSEIRQAEKAKNHMTSLIYGI